jgi:Mrp family chromosome partitioning ATPase
VASQESTGVSRLSITRPDLVVTHKPNSPSAQAYRTVRESLRHARSEKPIRSVLLADAGSRDQAGEAVANLAASFALNGDMTVLVDADSYNPVQHRLLNTSQSPGLVEWLSARDDNDRPGPLPTGIDCLSLLPAGSQLTDSQRSTADMLTPEACEKLVSDLTRTARFVLFHAPPLPASSEALAIAAHVDAVMLVVRSGTTKRTDAQRAKEALERVGANILGAVLTDTR